MHNKEMIKKMLDESVTKRLAFIKYMYKVAVELSERPEPLCSASILTFHDAIELFLQLASERLDVSKKDISFMAYWSLLSPKLPNSGLTQKESMRRLNNARSSLKHYGTSSSKSDIEAFRASATDFFEGNTPLVFGVEFSDLSLIELVQCIDAKNNLKVAEELLKENKIEDALDKVALAFAQLIDDYVRRKPGRFLSCESTTFLGSSLSSSLKRFGSSNSERELAAFIDNVKKSIESLQEAVKIISLGLDHRRYVKFRLLTPYIVKHLDETYHIIPKGQRGSRGIPTVEDVQFCIDFVIESAVTIQEFDFSVEEYR
jgi:hypothetical protein